MEEIYKEFDHALMACQKTSEVEHIQLIYLGKKGTVSQLLHRCKDVLPEERKAYGEKVNGLKKYLENALELKKNELFLREQQERILQETVDISLPSASYNIGSYHPINHMIDHIVAIMKDLGFSVQVGPYVDSEYYNFDVLNFASDHPAKDMQDTFYIEPGVLLRTHTSTVQGRVMEKISPPIRIVCPGRVFRNEDVSARSHAFFHQVEALYVDTDVSFQDLLWTFRQFVRLLFDQADIDIRVRPSYFPFVEPGVEIDVTCLLCFGKGCPICKGAGWLEICGAGMVHPQVLRNVGIDSEKYQGYAWGLGVERLIMIQKGIKDIRVFSENDARFLCQFQVT